MKKPIFNAGKRGILLAAGALVAAVALGVRVALPSLKQGTNAPDPDLLALYAKPVQPPSGGERVFHLGHSLVGRDMPAMLAQLAGPGHRYELQLGWGTSLRDHWELQTKIAGFAKENATPRYRDARVALASGEYDAFVMTEMVDLSDAIRYHDSVRYAPKWAEAAFAGNPDIKVYLYETWHALDAPKDWLKRFPTDLKDLWEAALLWPSVRATGRPIYLIPAGQVMARLVAEVEASPEGIGGLRNRQGLFAIAADGTQDQIHASDLGLYLVALTHYAVLYARSPVGLPHELLRADGTPAQAPSAELARRMQEIVWDVVTSLELTGVKASAQH